MGQELQVPDSFKGRQMAGAFATALNAQDDNLAEGIGQSYPVIGYKGKVWSLRLRGERKTIIRPDDGTPSAYLDVVVLGQTKNKSKSYYAEGFQDGVDGKRPTCASLDGLVPDTDVVARQSDSCALCPRNVWKTDAQTGRKGRDCSDYKRLAVLVMPTQTKPLYGQPLLEAAFLRVPPDSLNSLAIMGETMAAQGYHYSSYVTRITFDPQKAHPCMVFRPLQGLTDSEAPVILELRADPTVGRITGGDTAAVGMAAVKQALAPAGTTATGLVAQAQPTPSSSGSANGQKVGNGLGSAAVVQPVTPTPNSLSNGNGQATEKGLGLDTGLGLSTGANTVSASPPPPQPGLQTVADVGAPEASDDELDARIAGLISRG